MYAPNFPLLKHHPQNAQIGCVTSQTGAKRTKMQQISKNVCISRTKWKRLHLRSSYTFLYICCLFGIADKFNWYLRNLCPLLLIIGLCKTNTAKLLISGTRQTPKRKWFSSRLAVAFAQTTEARSCRRCSNYIWVISNFNADQGAAYIRCLTEYIYIYINIYIYIYI